jgi:uncharacterized protein YbjT (DUF2867 family)
MKIVVIGGTGLIGSKVVSRLGKAGHEAVAAAPSTGVDTFTGEGLPETLTGASVVVDLANSPSFEAAAALEFFQTATGNLLAAEAATGVGHHVALSVVGTGQFPDSGYFRAKLAQETLITNSSGPYSIVRATQFFEFVRRIADDATVDGTVRVPPVLFQPIAGDDVAHAVAMVAMGAPLNGRVEIAGPERLRMEDFLRDALVAWGDPRQVVTDPNALYFGAKPDEHTLVPGDDAVLGGTKYADWPGLHAAHK